MNLEDIKDKLDENNYPYFTDEYLSTRLETIVDEDAYRALIRELLLKKSNIQGVKLGDIEIPSPKNHFLNMANQYRRGNTGTVVRADGRS